MFGYDKPLYKSSPINVYMSPEEADKLEEEAKLLVEYTKNGKLSVEVKYVVDEEKETIEKEKKDKKNFYKALSISLGILLLVLFITAIIIYCYSR